MSAPVAAQEGPQRPPATDPTLEGIAAALDALRADVDELAAKVPDDLADTVSKVEALAEWVRGFKVPAFLRRGDGA